MTSWNVIIAAIGTLIVLYKIGVIIKAGSKGRESGPKVGSKFGQSNNNTKLELFYTLSVKNMLRIRKM